MVLYNSIINFIKKIKTIKTKEDLIENFKTCKLGKKNSLMVASWMHKNPKLINYCWEIIKAEEEPLNRRAAYAIDNCSEHYKGSVHHLIPALINFLPKTNSNAVRRHLSRILNQNPFTNDEDLQGQLAECCFNFLVGVNVDVAVKANCIDLLFKLCKIYPDLEYEFHSVLQDQLEKNTTAFCNRAKKILSGDYKIKN